MNDRQGGRGGEPAAELGLFASLVAAGVLVLEPPPDVPRVGFLVRGRVTPAGRAWLLEQAGAQA
ncbi:MAG: hypothetical protein SF051_11865 [Elusimicrobiota bacterium]|nr:hypothetical protein [Elusimicrobiota bacterium]